ncbi:MAG: cation-translocating P-type ATPase [Burkholderiaceae bacterium]|nr:cation-translocating P-type ATPase [Burkholderiaceae bacterium]
MAAGSDTLPMPMNAAAAVCADLSALDEPETLAGYTRWRADGGAESSLRLAGLHCAACAGLIETALGGVPGVLAARVNAAVGVAEVQWNPTRTRVSALVAAVRAAGYDAAPDLAADARALRQRESRLALWRLFVAAFCAMQVMMFATPIYLAEPGAMAPDQQQLLHWGSWLLTLPVLLFAAAPFFSGAWRALRQRRIGMDLPVALGIAVMFVASTGAAFDPGGAFGREVYFDSLAMFVAFLLGARWLEQRARQRAAEALEGRVAALPEQAMRVLDDGGVERVPASRLAAGDRVRVALGAAFPADGALLGGVTSVDESLLSGESRPLTKGDGDEVLAGSLNLGAPVEMRVLRSGAATRHAAIVALMREAMTQRPPSAASADRWAAPFLLGVIVLAALAALAWSVIEPSRALWVAVSVLIVTCPCALSLAAPSALLVASGHLARRGVLLRRPDALDAMARVQTLFIDKTGTLTDERPVLRGAERVALANTGNLDALHRSAAALAAWSNHPLSRALARAGAAGASGWTAVHETPGAGIAASDDRGREWRLGSAAFVGADAHDDDALHLWFGPAGQAWLRFDFDEALRPDAALAVARLQRQGIELRLLSGDRNARVQRLAARLGLTLAQGGATPQDKLAAVRAMQAEGHVVAMLGDGINDAPVLAQADVSLAMGEGADLARHGADAVLLSMLLTDVAHAFALARRTQRVVRQNMAWAAAYNAACIPLALIGWLPPWLAGLGMAASSLVVVGNALRLSR